MIMRGGGFRPVTSLPPRRCATTVGHPPAGTAHANRCHSERNAERSEQAESKNPYREKEFIVHNRGPSTRPRKNRGNYFGDCPSLYPISTNSAILACHSFGPDSWTELPFTSTA